MRYNGGMAGNEKLRYIVKWADRYGYKASFASIRDAEDYSILIHTRWCSGNINEDRVVIVWDYFLELVVFEIKLNPFKPILSAEQ